METTDNDPSKLNHIRDIIMRKAWYGLDPDTGAFDWERSLDQLAKALALDKQAVRLAIESAFTPDCLITVEVTDEKTGKTKNVPLIQILVEQGYEVYLWTVGDVDWQRKKIQLTGVGNLIDENRILCVPSDKIGTLKKLIEEQVKTNPNRQIIVVDDKQSVVDEVAKLSKQQPNLHQYHLKVNDPQANATAFHRWLKQQSADPDNQSVVVLDFDGVVANTDAVLFGPASVNLAQLSSSS